MERLTKIAVTLWACVFIAWQVSLMRSWPALPLIAGGVAALSMALTYFDRRGIGVVLATAYLFPALVSLLHGPPYVPFAVLWMAGIVGAILPDALRTPWHIPAAWRAALVFTALVSCLGALIVIGREVDGTPVLLDRPIYWAGGSVGFAVTWVLHVALVVVVGILWFDWLFGSADANFEEAIVTPLVFSAFAMSAVSVYQMFVDVSFVNQTAFATMERATGTMYDANVTGMLAALWTGGTFLWAERLRGWRVYVAPLAIAVNWIAVWGSSSRAALLAASAISLSAALAAVLGGGRLRVRRAVLAVALVLLVIGGAVGFAASTTRTASPAQRLWGSLPISSSSSIRQFAGELWNRNGYGAAAVAMIRRYPRSGVGIGSFYGFVSEFGARMGVWLPPDNAQNWLRHQVAELGFIGAFGWIVWFFAFAWFVLVPRRGEPPATWVARSMLIAFGALSLMGMSGQDVMVAMTFWTIAFWYVHMAGRPAIVRRLPVWNWVAVGTGLVVFAAASISVAASDLRRPERARRAGASFSYGFDVPLREGPDAGFRRTLTRATAVVVAAPRWMAVTVRLEDRGVAAGPIEVRVWKDGQIVVKAYLADAVPITGFVPIETAGQVVLEASAHKIGASRFWDSYDDLGVLIKWEFVDHPPRQFQGYQDRPSTGSSR